MSIIFCPGFQKHTQNKDLSYTNDFHPRYRIFLLSLSQSLWPWDSFSQGLVELLQHLFFPFENVISIAAAAALRPRGSGDHSALSPGVRQLGLSCFAVPEHPECRKDGDFCRALPPEPLCYSEEACKEEQRAAGFTRFALFYVFQQLFWKGCELKG